MKRTLTGTVAVFLVLLLAASYLKPTSATRVEAAPVYSPSVRAAVRLKYNPPRNWLRHYLGDDRYKIAGKVWKVVSTQLDTFYHRPNCPNMLRQPAGIVIGFPSVNEAADAGYTPDPLCAPGEPVVVYAGGASGSMSGMPGGGATGTTVNRGRTAQRIVLADGVSTVMLPPNWRRTQSGARTIAGYTTLSDMLQPLNGRGSLRFSMVTVPGGINVAPILTPTTFRNTFSSLAGRGQMTPQAAAILQNVAVSAGRAGGLSGVTLAPRRGARVPELMGATTIVGRGSKIYVVESRGNVSGRASILNSFRPR